MAKTPSNMVELGTMAPDFSLKDVVSGANTTYSDIAGKNGTLVMFICNHCPFVIHIQDKLVNLANSYLEKGIGIVAISSNDVVNYPEDAPDKMKVRALEKGFKFKYLYDDTQAVAKAYEAACTPDFFLYNSKKELVYRGQLDGSRPGNNIPVTGEDLKQAMDCLISNSPINPDQKASIGCNIKWK
jgi:peroxiredoxin